jgi:hypothetical protein
MRGNHSKEAIIAVFGRCALAAGIAVLVVACGLPPRTPTGAGHHSKPDPDVNVAACTRSDLKMRVDTRLAGVAAGTWHIPLNFRNISGSACKLAGFPVVGISYGPKGRRIGAPSTLDHTRPVVPLVVLAKHRAHLWILLAEVGKLPASVCRPVTGAGLRIRLPGQHRTTFVRHRLTTCARKIRGADILTVEPFRAGKAKRGTVN